MKPFMMAAAALALLGLVLMCSAPPALAEGQELQHPEAEKAATSAEAVKTEPEDKKTELSEDDQKTWGRSPPWHKAPHHHGHRGHHDDGYHGHHVGKKRSHHESKEPSHHESKEPSHHESKEPSHHGKPPHYDHDKKKPYPSPPY